MLLPPKAKWWTIKIGQSCKKETTSSYLWLCSKLAQCSVTTGSQKKELSKWQEKRQEAMVGTATVHFHIFGVAKISHFWQITFTTECSHIGPVLQGFQLGSLPPGNGDFSSQSLWAVPQGRAEMKRRPCWNQCPIKKLKQDDLTECCEGHTHP